MIITMIKGKSIKLKTCVYSAFAIMLTLVVSCHDKGDHSGHHHGVMEKIKSNSTNGEVPVSSSDYTDHIQKVSVEEGEHRFLIPERESQMTSFPCSKCHTEDLDKLQEPEKGKKAHWDIKLQHANVDIMNCTTCHSAHNMDKLKSITNESIDFNDSYKLCGQCHSTQFKDWKGGGHGKREGGWAPPRVSKTCVNCHNPHSPSFEARWPSRLNTQKIIERK